jgi:peptidoglycan hydrolase-like protein with peptidoglycan-binding domain
VKPVRPGSRGPAVEDIQRRLLILGFDLGSTGVDGVFMGATTDAVLEFQSGASLKTDGVVNDATWSALVDATFMLGDRMLYLRLPHFHGRDVRVLQEALNVLGFSCGLPDAIFGPHTEHAVREFQANCGEASDGIAGFDTVRAIRNLKHVWDGKDGRPPRAAKLSSARAGEVLSSTSICIRGRDGTARDVASRFVNLAQATQGDARVWGYSEDAPAAAVMVDVISTGVTPEGIPVVAATDDAAELAGRVLTALSQPGQAGQAFVVCVDPEGDEHGRQAIAVRLLDAVCGALSNSM